MNADEYTTLARKLDEVIVALAEVVRRLDAADAKPAKAVAPRRGNGKSRVLLKGGHQDGRVIEVGERESVSKQPVTTVSGSKGVEVYRDTGRVDVAREARVFKLDTAKEASHA